MAWGRQQTDDITILTLKAQIKRSAEMVEILNNDLNQSREVITLKQKRIKDKNAEIEHIELYVDKLRQERNAAQSELKTLKQRYNLNGSAPRDNKGRFVGKSHG